MASSPPARVGSLSTPDIFVPQIPTRPSRTVTSRPPAHSIRVPPQGTMTVEEDHRLWGLAASATEEAKLKTIDVTRLQTTATEAQAEAKTWRARAIELTRQANGLARKPTADDIEKSLRKELDTVRTTRLRLALALEKGRDVGWAVDKLDFGIEPLKVAMEDPMISGGLLKECVKEIGEGLPQMPGESKQRIMQRARTETDSDIEELGSLEDTTEVRALFKRNAEDARSAQAEAEPEDGARPIPAEHENLGEQQILAELEASAISIHNAKRA